MRGKADNSECVSSGVAVVGVVWVATFLLPKYTHPYKVGAEASGTILEFHLIYHFYNEKIVYKKVVKLSQIQQIYCINSNSNSNADVLPSCQPTRCCQRHPINLCHFLSPPSEEGVRQIHSLIKSAPHKACSCRLAYSNPSRQLHLPPFTNQITLYMLLMQVLLRSEVKLL